MKFSIKDFFSKCENLMENFIFLRSVISSDYYNLLKVNYHLHHSIEVNIYNIPANLVCRGAANEKQSDITLK